MPRFDIDEDSPLYTGPASLSAGNNDLVSPSDLAPPAPPVPMSMQNPNGTITKPYLPTPNLGTGYPKASTESIANTIQAFQNSPGIGMDQFKMAKSGVANFRDPAGGNNFYNRYNTTGYRNLYDDLGFSPFRDNDELYNKHASMWDNMQRTGAQTFANAQLAFGDATNFGSLTDRDSAKRQQEIMAIGTNTSGGAGAWMGNLALNAGYTLGIVAELAVEEIALAIAETGLIAATGATFGGTAPLLAANTAAMGARGARAFGKIKSAWKVGRDLSKSLNNLKDANKARSFFKSTVNFINPLENVTKYAKQGNKAWGTATNLERMAHVTRGVGAFYSDVQQLRLAYGEGSLEGGHVQLEMEDHFYESFKEEHGRVPNKEEAIKIRTLAQESGQATAVANIPFIMLSNKLLFKGLVRPKKPMLDVLEVHGKNILFDPKKALMQNYSKMPAKFLQKQMTYLRNPRMIGQKLKKYTGEALPEGIQELGQETISGVAKDYYTADYEGNADRGGLYAMIGDNIEKQASIEGFETFMSGFLMPGLVGPIVSRAGKMGHAAYSPKASFNDLTMRWTDPKQWKEIQAKRDTKINETVEKLNEFYADPTKYMSSDIINLQQQKAAVQGMDDAEGLDDTKTLHDIKDSSGLNHVITALEMGRFDTTMERLSSMKNISAEDLAESYPHLTHEEFNNILDKNIERGNKIKARWEYAQERLGNPYDKKKSIYKKGTPEWITERSSEKAWRNATNELVYNQDTFDRALERRASMLGSAHKESGLSNTPYSDFIVLYDHKDASEEVARLEAEVEGLKGEMIDPAQKKFKKEKEEKLKKLKAYTDAVYTGMENQLDEIMPEEDVKAIRKAFDEYVTYIGELNGDYVQADKMNATFKTMMDSHMLKDRANSANKAINRLLDPKTFQQDFLRWTEIDKHVNANKKNEIRKSLEEFIKMKDKNDMLNELYEAGMFFDPEDLVKLEQEGIVPDTFYLAEGDTGTAEEVPANSEMYAKALTILRKYLKTGSLTNISAGEVKDKDVYDQVGRNKLKNDTRTFEDMAKQYGFDPDAPETKIPLVQVLQTILDSKGATAREKELARKLMEVSDKNYFVTFVNNATQAGTYSDITQTVIDARWSSHDYKQGREGAALEQVILKQEMHRIADEAVRKDSSFKGEMLTLMQEAKMKYDMLSQQDKDALTDPNKRGFEGFATVEGFVAEAMSNEKFQSFLGTVTSNADNTVQTGWKAFVDKVLRQIGKMLGGRPSGTVLNSAMNLITAKIDSMYSSITPKAGKAGETIKETIRPDAISRNTKMSDLRSKHPEFANAMLEMYKAENEERDVKGEDLLDDDYLNKTDEEIFKSTAFLGWFKGPTFRKKEAAIKAYNKSTPKGEGKAPASPAFAKEDVSDAEYSEFETNGFVSRLRIITIAEKVKNKEALSKKEMEIKEAKEQEITQYINDSVAPVPSHINREMKIKLRALGYRKSSKYDKNNRVVDKGWDAMSTDEAWKIVYQGLTKKERNQIELAGQETIRKELAEQRAEIRTRVQEEIDAAETYEEIMAVRTELFAELSNDPLLSTTAGYKGKELDSLIEVRLEQIAFSVTFDKAEEGMTIILNDGNNTLAEITAKDNTGKFLKVAPLADLSKEEFIKEDEMEEKIKYLNSEAIQKIEITEEGEIDEGDQDTSNESLENAHEVVNNPDIVNEAYDADSDAADDWQDDINKCS